MIGAGALGIQGFGVWGLGNWVFFVFGGSGCSGCWGLGSKILGLLVRVVRLSGLRVCCVAKV